MLDQLKNLLFPQISAFVIEDIDHDRNVVIFVDKELALWIEIATANKPLKSAKIIGPYDLQLKYMDGTSEIKQILDKKIKHFSTAIFN